MSSLSAWIESEKQKFFHLMEKIEDLDEQISEIQGDLNLDLFYVKDPKSKEKLEKNKDSLKKRYKIFFDGKQMVWNDFLKDLRNFNKGWVKPDVEKIKQLSSFKKVDQRFVHFNEKAEFVSDMQVGLENELKLVNRYTGEFNDYTKHYNDLVGQIHSLVAGSRIEKINSGPLKPIKIKATPQIDLSPVDLEAMKEKVRTRGKLRSRLIREKNPELKALQQIKPPRKVPSKKASKPQKVLTMKELFRPLNKKKVPIYSKQTGKLERYIQIA